MSYLVQAFAKYSKKPWGKDETKVAFSTDKVLICEVRDRVDDKLYEARLHNGRDYSEPPLTVTISALPQYSLRK